MNPNRGLASGIGLISTTDLKIDWIWHLLLIIEAGVIGPTLPYFSITKSQFSRFYSFNLHPYNKYKWNKNAKNVIYNVIYLLKYSKVGPITCIVCHANWLISGFKIRSTFIRCHIQSISRSVISTGVRNFVK